MALVLLRDEPLSRKMEKKFIGMTKESWIQFGFQIVTFMLTIVGAVWFLAWLIAGIQATDAAGRALLQERIVVLEAEQKITSSQLDKLSTQLDSEKGIITDQTMALTRLTDAVDHLNRKK